MFGGKLSSKGQYSTRNSIPLKSVDRAVGPPLFSPNRIDVENQNQSQNQYPPNYASSHEIMRGPQSADDPQWYGPRKYEPNDIEVDMEIDIRNIPPPSPLTPSPGHLTHQRMQRPGGPDPIWPFAGDEAVESRTDLSRSNFTWLNDDVSEETLSDDGMGHNDGLSPRPPAPVSPPADVRIPDLLPRENRTSRWSDN